MRDIANAMRFIQENPLLYPVIGISLLGLELRRRQAGQLVILYSYFEPSPMDRDGVVSIRAIRHANEEDVLFGVNETRVDGAQRAGASCMFLR
jgi:hypothetical protein